MLGRVNTPVTLFAEPPLQAEIMMSNSIMVSLILGLPDCTTKTSFSRTLVRMRTLVSPLENWVSSASAGSMPRFWHILLARAGQEVPANINVFRMMRGGTKELEKVLKLEKKMALTFYSCWKGVWGGFFQKVGESLVHRCVLPLRVEMRRGPGCQESQNHPKAHYVIHRNSGAQHADDSQPHVCYLKLMILRWCSMTILQNHRSPAFCSDPSLRFCLDAAGARNARNSGSQRS